jgi:glycosyltransferase involved in cell wall biosynthesis
VRIEQVVAHAQLVEVFRSADLFVLPSRREGVGLLVCLEALSCGVPVAAGNAGGLPEIVHDGQNGVLFEPGRPELIADAIQALLLDTGHLAELASRARSSALPYDERVQAAKVAEVYREVASGE